MNTRLQSFWFLCQCLALDQDPETIERLRHEIERNLVDWESIVQIANEQLVITALWTSLINKGLHQDLPDELKCYLSGLHNLNLQRNGLIKQQAEEIITSLNRVGIEPILLKGAALLYTNAFSDLGTRILGDLDIMVSVKDVEESLRNLLSLGYRVHAPDGVECYRLHHHLPLMIRDGEPAAIELHRQLFRHDDIMVLTSENCFGEAVTIDTNSLSFRVLSLPHFVIHNIVHGEINHRYFYRGIISLRMLLDFAVISASEINAIDWKSIEDKMKEHGIGDIYWSYLHMAFTLLNASVPRAFGSMISGKIDANHGFDFLTLLEWTGQRDVFRVFRDDMYGHSQLYVDSGSGFNESESVIIQHTIQKSSLVFSLKDFATIKALRFDPLDGPCVIEILDAKLITGNGALIPLSIQTSNAIDNEGTKFVFSAIDPVILMSFDLHGDVPSSVEIEVNYLAWGYRALQECRLFQEKLVSDLRCQNASLDQAVVDRNGQIESLNQVVAERDGQIESLNQVVAERDGQIESLNQAVVERDGRSAELLQSTSWRLTAPLRFAGRYYKTAKRHLLGSPGK